MSDHDSGYDEFGLPEETGFTDNALAIDPDGCGCMDCLRNDAIHVSDTAKMQRLAKAAAAGRVVINRSYGPLVLVMSFTGEPRFVEVRDAHAILGIYAA